MNGRAIKRQIAVPPNYKYIIPNVYYVYILYTVPACNDSTLSFTKTGDLSMIQINLSLATFTESALLYRAVKIAAECNATSILTYILDSFTIHWGYHWGRAFGPMSWAILHRHLDSVNILYEKMPANECPIHLTELAARVNNIGVLSAVIKNTTKRDMYCGNAIKIATEWTYIDNVRLLIDSGCYRQDSLDAALVVAACNGYSEITEILLAAGGNPYKITNKQLRVIHYINKHTRVIQLLTQAGRTVKTRRQRKKDTPSKE